MAADLKLVKKTQMSAKSDFDQSKTDLELETLLHEQKIVAAKEEVNVLKNQLASEQEKNMVGLWFQGISKKLRISKLPLNLSGTFFSETKSSNF
jgi:hypothetical protein